MDVLSKIKELMDERQWTEYRLIKESGLPTSTIANIFHRDTVPSIKTLESICAAFGITLGQFFSDGDMMELTVEQKILFSRWTVLNSDQRQALINLMEKMN